MAEYDLTSKYTHLEGLYEHLLGRGRLVVLLEEGDEVIEIDEGGNGVQHRIQVLVSRVLAEGPEEGTRLLLVQLAILIRIEKAEVLAEVLHGVRRHRLVVVKDHLHLVLVLFLGWRAFSFTTTSYVNSRQTYANESDNKQTTISRVLI